MDSPNSPFFLSDFASSLEFLPNTTHKARESGQQSPSECDRHAFSHLHSSASHAAAFGLDQRVLCSRDEAERAYVASFLKDEPIYPQEQPTEAKLEIVDLAEDESEGVCSTHDSLSTGNIIENADGCGTVRYEPMCDTPYKPEQYSSAGLIPTATATTITSMAMSTAASCSRSMESNGSLIDSPETKHSCLVDMAIEVQPPGEIRTRTPREIRNFTVVVNVMGRPMSLHSPLLVRAELYYAAPDAHSLPTPVPGGDRILGGTTVVNVQTNGCAVFNNLSISEASTKHEERDFCIALTLIGGEPMQALGRRFTNSFYTYSHKKVLEKRRNVILKALSCSSGSAEGGVSMHVIGSPFIKGPYFSVIFMTSYGSVRVSGLDLYSDCVSFFQLPPCPGGPFPPGTEIPALVCVTNDGKNFSDPLEFVYIARGDSSSKKRVAHYSRM